MPTNPDIIYEQLKRKIINLELLPGTKIKEEELAAQFKTSRTPIRAVISRLVKDSLLVVAPKKGTYVSKIDISNISDYIYVRKAVEASVLDKVVEKITDSDLVALYDILDLQNEIIMMEPSIKKSKMFYNNDNQFHAYLFKIANMEGVWKIIHTNAIPLNRARIMANLRSNRAVKEVHNQHLMMLEYIKEKDLQSAKNILIKHLDEGFNGINVLVEKYNEYFI